MYSNTKSTINKYAIKKIIKNKIYRIISSQKGTLIYVSIIIKLEKPAKKKQYFSVLSENSSTSESVLDD